MKKILINATNLNEGGGVQVATSFLKDLTSLEQLKDVEWSVYVSPAVHRNLDEIFFDKKFFIEYQIVEPKEISFLNSYKLNQYDVVFTVFGPMFLPLYRGKHISGFAQPWVIYPTIDVLKKFSYLKRFCYRFKYFLVSYIFRQADVLVVESPHIRYLLLEKGYKNHIEVVENAVSSIFFDENEWRAVPDHFFDPKKIRIGILSGSYPHKNLDFIVNITNILDEIYPGVFQFIFTLKADKFQILTKNSRNKTLCNLGPIKLQQCPDFYKQVDAVMLPSLLECFSVTPLEAMLMKKVIFLSNRDFFINHCFNHAKYFDPIEAKSAVGVLESWFFSTDSIEKNEHIEAAYKYSRGLTNSEGKALSYINLIKK